MRIRILGSAAGGGFPQWNCACANCAEVRRGSARTRPRTQDSVGVTGDGARWVLLNASPDVHAQIRANDVLAPKQGRASPIAAVVLTNGDLDHVLGLLSLRESHRFAVYATRTVISGLVDRNAVFRTLARFGDHVRWRTLEPGRNVDIQDADGHSLGVSMRVTPIPGKLPIHLEGLATPSDEDNVGLWMREPAGHRYAVYATAVGALGAFVDAMDGAAALLFDGTFWSSDELARAGVGTARAEAMAHLPIGGPRGSLAGLARIVAERRIFTHVNNTNPILLADSPERRRVEDADWEVGDDGMELAF